MRFAIHLNDETVLTVYAIDELEAVMFVEQHYTAGIVGCYLDPIVKPEFFKNLNEKVSS